MTDIILAFTGKSVEDKSECEPRDGETGLRFESAIAGIQFEFVIAINWVDRSSVRWLRHYANSRKVAGSSPD
jgi:hypothetical protein